MHRFKKNYVAFAIFLIPALFFYVIFLVFPIFKAAGLSLFTWNGIAGTGFEFFGIKNYINLFKDPAFLTAMKNFILFVVLSVSIQIPVSLLLAVILNTGLKGMRFYKAAFFMPVIFSATAVSLMWKFILMPNSGLLDTVMKAMGLKDQIILWLADPKYSIFALIGIFSWQNLGIPMIIFLSGLVAIPKSYYEAAEVDGASATVKLFKITIPSIWETLKVNIALLIITTTKIFDIVYVLTKGGPNNATDVMATLMYKSAFESYRYGYASAISVMIFILGFVLMMVSNAAMKRDHTGS